MRVVNVGLLGYGLAGTTFHAPVIKAVPSLAIRAVLTSRADAVARDLPGAASVTDPEQIFADPAIELVVIATPNTTHADLAQRALRAGKHVVIDKPITPTSADADALIQIAHSCGRQLSVYQNRRWDGDFRTVQQVVAGGRLGSIVSYEAHYDRFRPAIKPGWREEPAPGSGLLFDLGSHLIDQALVLFGLPVAVVADVGMQRPEALVDDYFSIALHYPNRRAILRASTLVAELGPHFAVHGTDGSFVKYGMDPQEAALKAGTNIGTPGWGTDVSENFGTLVDADGMRETIATLPGAYADFYADMAAAIVANAPVPVSAAQARDVIRIIELANQSSVEGRTIAL